MKAPSAACASADGAFVVTKDKKNPRPRADRGSKAGCRPGQPAEIRRPATGTARRLTAQRDEKEEKPSAESSD